MNDDGGWDEPSSYHAVGESLPELHARITQLEQQIQNLLNGDNSAWVNAVMVLAPEEPTPVQKAAGAAVIPVLVTPLNKLTIASNVYKAMIAATGA